MKNLLSFAIVLALVAVASCGKSQTPAKPATPAASGAEAAKPGVAPAVTPAAEAAKPGAPTAAPAAPTAEAAKPATPEPAEPAVEAGFDKDKLSNCYTEVYCAQKKNEMSKLLDIYKKYGFNTPQDFTKTWMEAAKDKEWVTKLAHEVSKKCQ